MRTRETISQMFSRQIATRKPMPTRYRAELDLLYRDSDRNLEHLVAAVWADYDDLDGEIA